MASSPMMIDKMTNPTRAFAKKAIDQTTSLTNSSPNQAKKLAMQNKAMIMKSIVVPINCIIPHLNTVKDMSKSLYVVQDIV